MFEAIIFCLSLTAVDGDTIKCDGINMRLIGDGIPGIIGVDTPETFRPKCPQEKVLGDRATNRLEELLVGGVTIENTMKIDIWGRPLVRVRLSNGLTAGATLINEGLAEVWRRGKKINWCD